MSTFAATATVSTIVELDHNRAEIILRHTGGDDVWLNFGAVAVVGVGVRLSSRLPVVVIDDDRASKYVAAICGDGESCTGAWEDSLVRSSGMTYQILAAELGAYLGYGSESASWTDSQTVEIDRYIQAGVRQFYNPPAMQGVDPGYDWTFLRPKSSITTVAGTQTYALPRSFSRLIGDLYYDPVTHRSSVAMTSIGRVLELTQGSSFQHPPRVAATQLKDAGVMLQSQDYELVLWPVPDGAYTLTYEYEAYSGRLDLIRRFPLGGDKHGETILASCLAVAEMRANDQRGIQWANFESQIVGAINKDRKVGALHYGFMGQAGESRSVPRREFGDNYQVSYKGDTW